VVVHGLFSPKIYGLAAPICQASWKSSKPFSSYKIKNRCQFFSLKSYIDFRKKTVVYIKIKRFKKKIKQDYAIRKITTFIFGSKMGGYFENLKFYDLAHC